MHAVKMPLHLHLHVGLSATAAAVSACSRLHLALRPLELVPRLLAGRLVILLDLRGRLDALLYRREPASQAAPPGSSP